MTTLSLATAMPSEAITSSAVRANRLSTILSSLALVGRLACQAMVDPSFDGIDAAAKGRL
jgi:hypothetical protein